MDNIKELFLIGAIAVLIVVLVLIYLGRRTRRGVSGSDGSRGLTLSENAAERIAGEFAEQFRVQKEQFELISELTLAFTALFDFKRGIFTVSEAGYPQLGVSSESGEITEELFESLISEDDLSVFEDIKKCADIRMEQIAESPYVLRIKNLAAGKYECYMVKAKPLYDEDGEAFALVLALLNVEYYDPKA